MTERLAVIRLAAISILSRVFVAPMRRALPVAAAFALAGCGFALPPEATASLAATSGKQVMLSPDFKLVLPMPGTFGSHVNVRQLVTIDYGGNATSFEALLKIQPSEISFVAIDPLGRRAMTLTWNGARLVVEKAPFVPESVRPDCLLADLIAVYWPAPALQRAMAGSGGKVEDTGHRRVITADGAELLKASYAWTAKARLVGTIHYTNLSWGYTVSVKSLELKP